MTTLKLTGNLIPIEKEKTIAVETYIGDGVYVKFTGWDFVLRTPRGFEDHYIHLEPRQVDELMRFVRQCTEQKQEVNNV